MCDSASLTYGNLSPAALGEPVSEGMESGAAGFILDEKASGS